MPGDAVFRAPIRTFPGDFPTYRYSISCPGQSPPPPGGADDGG